MMYGKGMDQMSSSTMRAITKKKPMVNAGAKPVMTMPMAPKKTKKSPMGPDMSAAMDRGVRKALRMPLA